MIYDTAEAVSGPLTAAVLDGVLDAGTDALLVLDGSSDVLFLSRAGCRLFHCEAEDVVGRPLDLLLRPWPDEAADNEPFRFRASPLPRVEHWARMLARRPDGACFPADVSWRAFRTACASFQVVVVRRARDGGDDRQELAERERLARLIGEVGVALGTEATFGGALQQVAEAFVRHLDAAFARVWTLNEAQDVLELQASAGLYTHLNGDHARVPVGKFKIGLIAQERTPHLTNDVANDPRIADPAWARREGMVAFAGYPLLVESRLVGVLALFARRPLTEATLEAMAAVAGAVAQFIERKKAEAALQRSEELLRQIAENIQEVFWLREPGSKELLYVSPAYETVFGLSRQRLREAPHTWLEAIHPDDVARVIDTLTQNTQEEVEYRLGTEPGPVRWVRARTFPVRDAAGRVTRQAGVIEDVTERKKLECQLRHIQKMEAVGRLAGGIAHDFNNILTIINGYSEMALGLLTPASALTPLLQEIRQAGQKAAALTRQLLAFSRKQTFTPIVLDLNVLIRGFERMLHRLIGEDIVVTTTLAPDLPAVRADPGQLEQVLINLAVNARDAMPAGGRLTVETSAVELGADDARRCPETPPGPYVLLAVSDTGCGMDRATLARIFEPFFTTKEAGKGTGLGLATVYGIIRQSRGHIIVTSEVGVGSTFKVYLPIATNREDTAAEARGEDAPRGTETVLVVEDEAQARTLARQVLEGLGYSVLEADGWQPALDLVLGHAGPIDLLLTDVGMPGKNGKNLIERLFPIRPRMKVLYTSGYTDNAIIHHGVLPSGVAFLHKPFTARQLAVRVREALGPHVR